MALQHDNQGFLVGAPIDLGRAVRELSAMRQDVHAIRQAVAGLARPAGAGRQAERARGQSAAVDAAARREGRPSVATPGMRDARGRFMRSGDAADAQQAARAAGAAVAALRAVQRSAVAPAGRDGRGRFAGRAGPASGTGGDWRDGAGSEGAIRGLASKLVNAVRESGSGMGDADPTIKAFGEVAQPLARGFELLGGGDRQKRQEGWLRRIHGSLNGLRKEEGLFNKVAAKRLKAIEEKPGAEGDSGSGGMLGLLLGLAGMIGPLLVRLLPRFLGGGAGGLLSRVFGVGAGSGVLGRIFGAGGKAGAGGFLGRLFGGGRAAGGVAGSAEGGMLARTARMAGKFGKRLPIIGSLLALGLGAMDAAAIEGDATTSRRQKNAKQGKLWGSVGGGLAGGAAGAAICSFIFPGVGTAVGGVLGAVLGDWLGGAGGELIGEHFEQIASVASSMWTEIKVVGLGTWDWVRSSWDSLSSNVSRGFDVVSKRAVEIFDSLKTTMGDRWQQFLDQARGAFDGIKGMFTSIINGLKEMEVIGPAIRRFEEAAKAVATTAAEKAEAAKVKTNEVADAAGKLASDLAARTADATVAVAGRAWNGLKSAALAALPDDLKRSVAVRRAVETGADYRQGNIAGLDDAHTRALVASTAETESSGGRLDVVNGAGYMGRYQAGAGWLADAGLIRGGAAAVHAAMKADGFRREYEWGESGGMTRFLRNEANWNNGLSYERYLASADVQDAAFKTNSDRSYRSLLRKGVITAGMSQDEIAGILKARHLGGEGAAAKAARGEAGPADSNGTTPLKYKNDLAAGNAYAKAFAQATAEGAATAGQAATPTVPRLPVAAPAIATPVVVSTSIPKVPTMPAAPAYAEAPQIAVPLGSGEPARPVVVAQRPNDAGQDLRERGIAHIVTGGLAGS